MLISLIILFPQIIIAENLAGEFQIESDSLTPRHLHNAFNQNVSNFHIGVALSGGGSRGFAHIGVLDELEKQGVDVDIIAGTSMGGIIAGLYAMGMSPAEIEQEALNIDWSNFFSDKLARSSLLLTQRAETEGELLSLRFDKFSPKIPTALTSGQKLLNILYNLTQTSSYFYGDDFTKLEKSLAIVTTDIVTGDKVVFTSGSLVTAMRATMGVPLAFTPLEDKGRLLMDGGLVAPLPSTEVKELGADFVIASNTTANLLTIDEIENPFDIANQTTTILSSARLNQLAAESDFVIKPSLTGITSNDFDLIKEAIESGRESVRIILDSLRYLIEKSKTSNKICFDSVNLKINSSFNNSYFDQKEFESAFCNDSLEKDEVRQKLSKLFNLGAFSSIKYYSEIKNDKNVLQVEIKAFPQIKGIKIIGNNVIDDSTLFQVIQTNVSDINNYHDLQLIYESILSLYKDQGYDLAQIFKAVNDPNTEILTIEISEGKIIALQVEGNKSTRWWVVASYFPLKVGDYFNKNKAAHGVQEIHACGLFENVNIQLSKLADGVLVKLIVKEKNYTYVKLGAHYHEDFHPESFIKLGYANIGGTGNELSIFTKFSEKHKAFQLQMRADRIFRTFITYSIRSYYTNDKINLYDEDNISGHRTEKRLGLKIGIGQQLSKLGLFDVTARYEQIRFSSSGVEAEKRRNITSLQFNLKYDTKDRFTFTTKGRASEMMFELASDFAGGEEIFQKFEGYIESFQNIGKHLNIHPRFSIGLSEDGLPLYDKFYLGGTRTFMGYGTNQLVGDKYFLTNLELRLGPMNRFYLSLRYDMGEVFSKFEEVRFKQLRHAFGFMLSLDTPLGPLSLAYGRAEGKLDNVYLNIGFDF